MSVWDWIFILPTWLNVVTVAAVLIYTYGVWPFKTTKLRFPGPPPTPFIGNLGQLMSKGVADADSENIKKYGDVVLTWGVRQEQVLVADPDMIKEIFVKQFPYFVNRMKFDIAMSEVESQQLTFLEDDHWKFVRATVSPAFSSGRLREMVPLIQNCLQNLTDVIAKRSAEGKSLDVQEIYKAFTLDAISATAFGMDSSVQKNPEDPFIKLLKKLFGKTFTTLTFINMLFPFMTKIANALKISSFPKEWREAIKVISKDVKENIAQRKQHKTNRRDLLQVMIDASIDNLNTAEDDVDKEALKNSVQNQRKGLTETEIMAQSFVFLLGGYATTSGALTMMSYLLALNPECQEKLIKEIDENIGKQIPNYENVMSLPYLDMCLSETLRLFPLSQRLSRVANQDVMIKGHLLPKDLAVQIPVNYIHYNPKYWPEPEIFRPERFTPEEKAKRHPYVYLPFGVGPRNCIGMRLAQLKTKMAFATLLQRFRIVRSVDTEVPVKLSKIGVPEAENGVWLKFEPRTDI